MGKDRPEGLSSADLTEWRLSRVEEQLNEIHKSMESIDRWIRGVMGSLVLALILLVIDIITKHSGAAVSIEGH